MKIFFDLDGTLIDVAPRHYQVYEEVTLRFSGSPLPAKAYWELKRKKAKWPELLRKSSLSETLESEFLGVFITKIEAMEYLEEDTLFPEALNRINELISMGHALYLVSLRRNATNLDKELDNLGVKKFFASILSGHSETDGYDKKIELIKDVLDEEKGVIIGDTEADIVTGKHIGLVTVAVTSGIRDEIYLSSLSPDYMIENIRDLKLVNELYDS